MHINGWHFTVLRRAKAGIFSRAFLRDRRAGMASEQGQVIAVHSVDEWKNHFQKGIESKKLVVVDFFATWCGPCRTIAPIVAEIAKNTPNVTFLKVDVDELSSLANQYEIESMPTFLFFKEGKVVDKVVGTSKEQLQDKVNKHGVVAA